MPNGLLMKYIIINGACNEFFPSVNLDKKIQINHVETRKKKVALTSLTNI